jgi:hypothetical protein
MCLRPLQVHHRLVGVEYLRCVKYKFGCRRLIKGNNLLHPQFRTTAKRATHRQMCGLDLFTPAESAIVRTIFRMR